MSMSFREDSYLVLFFVSFVFEFHLLDDGNSVLQWSDEVCLYTEEYALKRQGVY